MSELDALAAKIAAELGPNAKVSHPAVPKSSLSMLAGVDPAEFVRHVVMGKRSAMVLSVPPGWPENPGSDTAGRASRLAERVNYLVGPGLGNGRDKLPNFVVVQLQEGWDNPESVAYAVSSDMNAVEKYALVPGADINDLLDRIPTLDRMWMPTKPEEPSWLSGVKLGSLGPLSEVDIELAPGPGLTVLSGGNSTGKTLLLHAIQQALTNPEETKGVEFTAPFCMGSEQAHFMVRSGLPKDPQLSAEQSAKMARFRRMMDYGDAAGELFLPIAMESSGFQRLERVGLALTAAASLPCPAGVWPGLLLDVPTQGVDDMRGHKLRQVIAALSRDRQVVVSTRGEAPQWLYVAKEVGSEAVRVDLNGGKAVLRADPKHDMSRQPTP